MKNLFALFIAVLAAATVLAAGCGVLGKQGSGSSGAGRLYVSISGSNLISRYDRATAVFGSTAVTLNISGASTTLNDPRALFYDSVNDRLYVANRGSNTILVFDDVGSKKDDVAPSRTISSAALSQPSDLTVDLTLDRLYVSNTGANNLLVFAGASTASGAVAPAAAISSSTGFNQNHGLYLDTVQDVLYVCDTMNHAIKAFSAPSAWAGAVTKSPVRTVSGAMTQLQEPISISIDSTKSLVVSQRAAPLINVYADAINAVGNMAPTRYLAGTSTGLALGLAQVTYVAALDEVAVAGSAQNVLVFFSNFSVLTGNVAPSRALQVGATPMGIAVDLTH